MSRRFKVYGPHGSHVVKAENFEVDHYPGFSSLRFFLNGTQVAHFPAGYDVVDETALEESDDGEEPDFDGTDDEVYINDGWLRFTGHRPDDGCIPADSVHRKLLPEQVWWHPDYGVIRIVDFVDCTKSDPVALIEWSSRDGNRGYAGPYGVGDHITGFVHPAEAGGFLIQHLHGRRA